MFKSHVAVSLQRVNAACNHQWINITAAHAICHRLFIYLIFFSLVYNALFKSLFCVRCDCFIKSRFVYILFCLLVSIFSFSLQSYKKFFAKSVLKLFEFNSTFKDNHMIVFCILYQAQTKVLALALINKEVFAYVFMNKFFTQQHHLFLHQLIHSHRLWEFNNQVTLIDDITYVVEITIILNEYIKRLFFYVIELNQYLIVMSLSWLHYYFINLNLEHNILILSFFFCFNHCFSFFIKIYDLNQQEENFSFKVNKVTFSQSRSQFTHKK